MGDISREPLRYGRRAPAGPGKGPSELIRFEELSLDERDHGEPGHGKRDHGQRSGGAVEGDTRMSGDPGHGSDPEPGQEPMDLRPRGLADPIVPLHSDPFAEDEPVAGDESLEAAGTIEAALEAPSDLVETPPEQAADAGPSAAELAEDLGVGVEPEVETAAVPALAVPAPNPEADALADAAPELHDPAEIARVALAVLLSAREPLSALRLAEVVNAAPSAVEAALTRLEGELRTQGLPLEILVVDGAYRIATTPAVYPYLVRLKKLKKVERLTPASLETLAVIAYRQPVIRAEIEAIRGVKAGPVLKSLLDHKLVRVVGRADVPGHPLQYGTTQQFLDRFGLRSLEDLPTVQELKSLG